MAKIRETDVKNSRGEIVISPGLKVRHKDSQFEYTVDSVTQDRAGKIQIILNLPDEARFEPNIQSDDIIQSRVVSDSNLIYEIDPAAIYYEPEEGSEEDSDMILVTQDEFERDYEVK